MRSIKRLEIVFSIIMINKNSKIFDKNQKLSNYKKDIEKNDITITFHFKYDLEGFIDTYLELYSYQKT